MPEHVKGCTLRISILSAFVIPPRPKYCFWNSSRTRQALERQFCADGKHGRLIIKWSRISKTFISYRNSWRADTQLYSLRSTGLGKTCARLSATLGSIISGNMHAPGGNAIRRWRRPHLTLLLLRVINVKFLLPPHHKYYTTHYEELGFS